MATTKKSQVTPASPSVNDAAQDAIGQRSKRSERVVAMSHLRRAVAVELVRSRQPLVSHTAVDEVDMSAVLNLGERYRAVVPEAAELHLWQLAFFTKAAAVALADFPALNAEVRGNNFVYREYVDVAVTIASEVRVAAPVIRDADVLRFAEVERAIVDYAERILSRRLIAEELEGGTFSITDCGVFDGLMSAPALNAGQSGTLGLHAVRERPVAIDGLIVVRPMMYLALSYDARVVEERDAIALLKRVRQFAETPTQMLLRL